MAAEFGILECTECSYSYINKDLPWIAGMNCPQCGRGTLVKRR